MPERAPAEPLSRRARHRRDTVAEIKAAALRQMAVSGSADVAMREIGRQLGMTASALYRYFDGRDGLLIALIVDAYDASADAVDAALAATRDRPVRARWLAAAFALRAWALEHPTEWGLIYGNPVPGYDAPEGTRRAGTRVPLALVGLLAEATARAGARRRKVWERRDAALDAGLAGQAAGTLAGLGQAELPVAVYLDGLAAWTALLGLISMEVFGQLSFAVGDHAGPFFATEMELVADRLEASLGGTADVARP